LSFRLPYGLVENRAVSFRPAQTAAVIFRAPFAQIG
jgi:hypothetical protein